MDDRSKLLAQIFMPLAHERRLFVQKNKIDFVHYTTAENALNILRSRRVYLRNTVCMNDYREFQHGLDLLFGVFADQEFRTDFLGAANACGEGVGEEALKLFDNWLPHNQFNVYVTCLSEHDPSEDEFGRLSMWRAYNRPGSIGVAIVLNQESFFQESTVLGPVGSPVAYFDGKQFAFALRQAIKNIKENRDLLTTLPRQQLIHATFTMLLFGAACAKHPGFAEEREWRLVYLPKMMSSKVLETSVETIGGVPQLVYKIPLIDRPQDGLINIEPATLIKKIIIGPSNFPYPIYEAFVAELKNAGVEEPGKKIVTSSIPLRT